MEKISSSSTRISWKKIRNLCFIGFQVKYNLHPLVSVCSRYFLSFCWVHNRCLFMCNCRLGVVCSSLGFSRFVVNSIVNPKLITLINHKGQRDSIEPIKTRSKNVCHRDDKDPPHPHPLFFCRSNGNEF